MSINGINNYNMTGLGSSMVNNKAGDSLDMNDFLSLLVAQMTNQDMYNTMDDSQFMAQMAQFSMLQAISDLSQMSATSYSVSLIGKEVTIAERQPNGELRSIVGLVEGVTLFNGESHIVVEGSQYPLSSVMEVFQPKIIIPDATLPQEIVEETEEAQLVKETPEVEEPQPIEGTPEEEAQPIEEVPQEQVLEASEPEGEEGEAELNV
ncbi:MAG: flagellar hook assembly protein FlgD [Anaerovoracaceae bacterium]|jgi:flagellar basal-body rod modification protein FlgD